MNEFLNIITTGNYMGWMAIFITVFVFIIIIYFIVDQTIIQKNSSFTGEIIDKNTQFFEGLSRYMIIVKRDDNSKNQIVYMSEGKCSQFQIGDRVKKTEGETDLQKI